MFNRLLAMLFVLFALLAFSACGATSTDAPASAVEDDAPKDVTESDGVLRVIYPVIWDGKDSIDPASPVPFDYANLLLYDRLVRFDDDRRLAPSLAVSWEANDSVTEWRFTLREGVTFHDGQPLTSADVVYTFQRILDPATESPLADALSFVEAINAPTENQVVFSLSQNHAEFPLILTSYFARIIPADSGDTISETGMGTGPFKLESLNTEGTSTFIANEDYWDGAPQLTTIELIAIADADARASAILAGQADLLLDVDSTQIALFENNPALTTLSFPTGEWTGFVMRLDTPPFDDVRVRQAMKLVTDRQTMIDLVLGGQGTLACDTPVSKVDTYRWDTDCSQDIEQARALLAEAGYPDGIDVPLYVSDAMPQLMPMAEVYQEQARAGGININLEVVPADSYWTEVWMVEPFFMTFWKERPADLVLNLVWHFSSTWNESYFNNPEFDQNLDGARDELDFDERRELYQQAQQLIFEEGGHLIPFHTNLNHVVNTNIAGVKAKSYREFDWNKISKSE